MKTGLSLNSAKLMTGMKEETVRARLPFGRRDREVDKPEVMEWVTTKKIFIYLDIYLDGLLVWFSAICA